MTEQESLESGGRRLHLHHKNYDKTIPDLVDVELLCAACHHSHHGDGHSRERFPMVARAVGDLLKALGVDLEDENFIETPRRVADYFLEHFVDGDAFTESLESFKEAVFPSDYRGMVVQNFDAVGMCPHHLLPVLYEGCVGYIPEESTIGISKLSRIAKQCLQYPILQETGTLLVADTLEEVLDSSNVAIALRGRHMCMNIRGVKAHNASTTTSELRGAFREDASARAEFLDFVRQANTLAGRV